jgi:DNA-binding NarL/FixJ family response regulator
MKNQISALVGCGEPMVVDALRILLASEAQDSRKIQIRVSRSYDEFIEQARTGKYGVAIMHANCLIPARPLSLLEQAILAVRSIKASCPLRLVVLTTMDEWVAPLRESGADVCLKAPFAATELLAAVSAAF